MINMHKRFRAWWSRMKIDIRYTKQIGRDGWVW